VPHRARRLHRAAGWLAAGAVVARAIGALPWDAIPPALGAPPAAGPTAAAYVGAKACAGCHAKEHDAWRGSHHALAMQEANERTVLGDFAGAKFSYAGTTSRFFRRDKKFYVHTDGPDGKLADYEIRYTFGVSPLQQYLIELPGGRLQALGIAWDARPKAAGGQRWFHLYPKDKIDRAVEEYRAAQALNADRADAWLNLGALAARLGGEGRAEEAYRRAVRLQPSFMPPSVNLADLYRAQGRDPEGERVLREALGREPGAADVHHALGLLLVRGGRRQDALAELGRAAELAPDMPRYAYAYALGLDATGERAKALSVLADAQRRFTGEREILEALVQLSLAAGDADASARWAQKLRDLDGGAR